MMTLLQAVLADGRLAIVTADSLRILTNGRWRRVATSEDTDLWFGLRGAGSSFAIVTEFTVSVMTTFQYLSVSVVTTLQCI